MTTTFSIPGSFHSLASFRKTSPGEARAPSPPSGRKPMPVAYRVTLSREAWEIGRRPESPFNRWGEQSPKTVRGIKAEEARVQARVYTQLGHLAAARSLTAGGVSFTYRTGPDGRNYAVDGRVQIDLLPVPGNADASRRKARAVLSAALALADVPAHDRAAAAAAGQTEPKSRADRENGPSS